MCPEHLKFLDHVDCSADEDYIAWLKFYSKQVDIEFDLRVKKVHAVEQVESEDELS